MLLSLLSSPESNVGGEDLHTSCVSFYELVGAEVLCLSLDS